MKKLLPLLILLTACHKPKTDPTPTHTIAADTIQHFIRNWDNIPIWTGWDRSDTMDCYTSHDTSFVIYKGQKLFVWTLQKNDSSEVINNCFITPLCFDTSIIYSRCQVSGSRYYDTSVGWLNEFQTIWLADKSHFDTSGEGIYSNF
jgi:hypothetical protein